MRASRGAVVVAVLGGVSACRTPGSYQAPLAQFEQGNTTALTTLATYYTELNRFERDAYLDERLYDSGLEVLATDASGQGTPLLGKIFSPESIQARMDAISLLGLYATRLTALAGADTPGKLPDSATALGTQLGSLGDQLQTLSKKGDATASRYVAPVTTLVGVVGSLLLEAKQGVALQKGIEQGAPAVTSLLDLLEVDLVEVIGPQRLTAAKQSLASRVVYYNQHRDKLSLAERRAILDDIRQASDAYEALVVAQPVEVARALRTAHEALLTYARSDRKPQSLEDLSTAMQSFQARAQTAAAAVQALQNAPKE